MKHLTTLVFILASIMSSPVFSNETGYEVELIIFEDAKARYLKSEDWSYNDNLNRSKEEIIITKVTKDKQYQELAFDQARLAGSLDRIVNNPNFNVLVKKRWKQTGFDRDKAFNIEINSLPDTVKVENTNNDASAMQIDMGNELVSYVKGNVKLIMSRYLHFSINLQYYKPGFNEQLMPEFKTFPIVSERRMKSKEVHYIDHPLVGVIVLATPFKIKQDTVVN